MIIGVPKEIKDKEFRVGHAAHSVKPFDHDDGFANQ